LDGVKIRHLSWDVEAERNNGVLSDAQDLVYFGFHHIQGEFRKKCEALLLLRSRNRGAFPLEIRRFIVNEFKPANGIIPLKGTQKLVMDSKGK